MNIISTHTKYIFLAILFLALPATTFATDEVSVTATDTVVSLPVACPVTTSSTIDLEPKIGTYIAGEEVTLRIVVTSVDCPVIGVEARLTYNPNTVRISDVSREGSMLNSWTQEPTINGEIGEILFGGTLATSTVLNGALMITLHATPLRAGEMYIRFENEAVIHDGDGNNIVTGFTSGKYRINPQELAEPSDPEPIFLDNKDEGEVLGATTESPAVIISSPTHPNQSSWYNASSSSFLFKFQGEVKQLRLSFDQNKDGRGKVLSSPIVITKEIADLENGIWFLHASATVSSGATSLNTYQIQVDQIPPENLELKEIERDDSSDPNIVFEVTATDTISGIDHYEFSLDGGAPEHWESVANDQYHHNVAIPGTHEITITAFDKAGNTISRQTSFEIAFLPQPHIKLQDQSVHEGDSLALQIESVPGATLDITISRNSDSPTVEHTTMDAEGKMIFESALALSPGSYTVIAIARDQRGGVSQESERLEVEVSSSLWGLTTRHPLIPISIIGLLILLSLGVLAFKKINLADDEEYIDESTEIPAYAMAQVEQEDVRGTQTESIDGQIILQPRIRRICTTLPPTRL